jgi:hypothetical protein
MKLKVISLVMLATLLASIMLIGVGSAQYLITAPEPCPTIVLKLPNGTQDMNVTTTQYPIGSKFNVTVWFDNVTLFDGFGLTIIWNSTFEVMTAFNLGPALTVQKVAGNWTFSALSWSNNATLMPSEPWTGVLPLNVGVLNDFGGGAMADAYDFTGNVLICTLTFMVTYIGPHGFYINKDPANYAPWPYTSGGIYLKTEGSVPPQYALPFCSLDEYYQGTTETMMTYQVVWSSNPYFAPPTPYSGALANAMLWIMPYIAPPTAVTAKETVTPTLPTVGQTVTVTVTTTPGLYSTYTFPVTNVTINWGDGSPENWTVPIANVATFYHAYAVAASYTIKEYCVAKAMVPYFPTLAWANISSAVTVLAPVKTGIDVFEVREPLFPGDTPMGTLSGTGANQPGRPYAPQDLVHLQAYVVFGGNPVQGKIVEWQINISSGPSKGQCILFMTSQTNTTGYAELYFRIASICPIPNAYFGKWDIYTAVSIAQVTYNDTMEFDMGYILSLSNMVATNSPQKVLNYITFNVTISNIDWISVPTYMILVCYDTNQVPIEQEIIYLNDVAGETQFCHPMNTTVTISSYIPKWAFVGTGTAYINLFTGLPALGGVPFCPEASATYYIQSG